jgi:hypothetical protein
MPADKLVDELLDTKRAREWRRYVLTPALWTQQLWDEALARGLAVRRASRDQSAHRWTLTDQGLDLFIEGA